MDKDLEAHLGKLMDDDNDVFENIEPIVDENNSDKVLDNSEEAATVNDEELQAESVDNDFEAFLATLPNTREREIAKEAAINHKWDYKKYQKGGKSAEVWLATTPYINMMKEYQQEIKELKKLVKSNTNSTVRSLKHQKQQAEDYLSQARDRLAAAKEAGDIEAMESAYNDVTAVKELLQVTDEQLNEVSEPEMSQDQIEYRNLLAEHTQDFIVENWEWIHPESPDYDQSRSQQAIAIEQSILQGNPRIDPRLLYKRVKIELSKLESPKNKASVTKEATPPPAARKPAIESISSVRSTEHRTKSNSDLTESQRLVMQALNNLNKTIHSGQKFMSAKDFQKKIIDRNK
jgi:hypothetical protein